MSQENVEVVRSSLAALSAGDWEAVRETLDPEVVIGRELEGWPETGPFVGRDAVMRQWEGNREPWGASATVEPVSIIDAGDRVVARVITHGAGRGPAVHVEYGGNVIPLRRSGEHMGSLGRQLGVQATGPMPESRRLQVLPIEATTGIEPVYTALQAAA